MNTKHFLAIWLIVASTLLIAFAVVVKPTGEISSSVNLMAGEMFATALAFVGIEQKKEKRNENDPANQKSEAA